MVHAQICAEGWESGGVAMLLSSFYNELFSVSGGCYEMVLPPPLREQIVHKVLQCFSLLSKEIYKYLKSTLMALYSIHSDSNRDWRMLLSGLEHSGCKSSLCGQTIHTCIIDCEAITTSQL